jgi:hypothetical protein
MAFIFSQFKADRQEYMQISSMAFIFSQFCTYFQYIYKFHSMGHIRETRGDAGGCGTALQAGRSRVRFSIGSLGFFIDFINPAAIWRWSLLSL